MRARDMKVLLYAVMMFAIIGGPIYYLTSHSMHLVTGNAAVSPGLHTDHYDVYCTEEYSDSVDDLEKIGSTNNSEEIPTKCFRMPTAYVIHVPVDEDGEQVGPPDVTII